MTSAVDSLHERPVELLQRLIRFDTTNPPGNEAECITFVRELLEAAGCETETYALDPRRPNLVSRLAGAGNAAPLLLYGHVDVVTTRNQPWTVDPFAGVVQDACVWGRGALDMKSGVTMLLCAFIRAKVERRRLPGDVVLAVLSDEEDGGDMGARFLVEQHPELFEGVRYALGEVGGLTVHVDNARFYPIEIAQKQICWLKAIVRGRGGHGAMVMRGGAMARLGKLLTRLDRARLPVHVTPAARRYIETMAEALPGRRGEALLQLIDPTSTESALRRLGQHGRRLEPMLRHTVNATILRASDKINVIPSHVEVELDGRLLPGFEPADLIGELQEVVGDDIELELVRYDPGLPDPDLGLFDTLAGIVRDLDPGSVPLPLLMTGVSDARFFARLGIQTYGFLPGKLPKGFSALGLAHAADERIPVEALDFGVRGLGLALERFA